MSISQRLERSFKPRFAVIYPYGIFVAFFCFLTESSFKAGIGYIIAGILIRLWSNGYAIKNDKLTTSGPYAFVRNPLYLGTFLIAIGFVLALQSDPPHLAWIAGIVFLIALSIIYYFTIKEEQGMLLAKFKDAYKNYCAHVPAMVPLLFVPYSKGEKWPFNLERLFLSKEHKPVFWIYVLLVAFHIKTRLLIEHQDLTLGSWALIGVAIFLIIVDMSYESNKAGFKKK